MVDKPSYVRLNVSMTNLAPALLPAGERRSDPGWPRRDAYPGGSIGGQESCSLLNENGTVSGIRIIPDIYAGYLSRKIIHKIRPSDQTGDP